MQTILQAKKCIDLSRHFRRDLRDHRDLREEKAPHSDAPTLLLLVRCSSLELDDIDEAIADVVKSSRQLVSDLSIFNDPRLTETIIASDSTQSRYEYILHVVNHSTYRRGQVVTMCRALDVTGEIPVTD
jgi:hypothetical protein